MSDEPDPTKDPKFKQVVDHFLKTPPKPHKLKKGDEAKDKRRSKKGRANEDDDQ